MMSVLSYLNPDQRPLWRTFGLCLLGLLGLIGAAVAEEVSLQQSVDRALTYNPEVRAVFHQKQAATQDLQRARQAYYPSVDLRLGYGLEQHSDTTTRRNGADPDNGDWDPRGEAALSLTQPIYSGGEIGQQVDVQKAVLQRSIYQQQGVAQQIALAAVSAHLEVLRQREFVALAETNVDTHREIYQLLTEREEAGVGNIADTARARARLEQAQSTLSRSRADLQSAIATYLEVTGKAPEPRFFVFNGSPDTVPASLSAVLQAVEQASPELKIANADLAEVEAREELARTAYRPKLELQLNSRYDDQKEGDDSWQHTNEALLQLRWNLFRGGQDRSATRSAIERRLQVQASRDATQLNVRQQATTAWQTYRSLQRQKEAFRRAVRFSRETLEAYLKQFSVSRRSLLDLLTAQSDYFQFANQYVGTTLNETQAAYQLLALANALEVPSGGERIDFSPLSKPVSLALQEPTDEPEEAEAPAVILPSYLPVEEKQIAAIPNDLKVLLEIGPCLTDAELTQITAFLDADHVGYRVEKGRGPVNMVRLVDGVFSEEVARQRLKQRKKQVPSAFILPQGAGQYQLVLASFYDSARAERLAQKLTAWGMEVDLQPVETEVRGSLIRVEAIPLGQAQTVETWVAQESRVLTRRLPH